MSSTTAPFSVECPACDTSFPVDPERVPTSGVRAICSTCMRTFLVILPESFLDHRAPEPQEDGTTGIREVPAPAPATEDAVHTEEDSAEEPTPDSARADLSQEGSSSAPAPETVIPPPPEETGAEKPSHAPGTDIRDAGFHDLTSLTSEALEEAHEEDEETAAAALSSGISRFGRRDPHERARRLARVLVSDIIAYYPEKHARAVEEGRVKETFAEEVEKSRREYTDQVGEEMAASTDYFRDALNQVLARGRIVF